MGPMRRAGGSRTSTATGGGGGGSRSSVRRHHAAEARVQKENKPGVGGGCGGEDAVAKDRASSNSAIHALLALGTERQ